MSKYWPTFRSFWFHVPRTPAANDNQTAEAILPPHRNLQALARTLAHQIDRRRFMSAWTQVGVVANRRVEAQ